MRTFVVGDLATDVYLPSGAPTAVVVVRTAYDKSCHRAEAEGWVARGIAFVAQDVRGRYASPGSWSPYVGERADGAGLLDWVSDQSWCPGKVVLTGASYSAFTAWTAAVSRPSVVGGVMSLVPAMGFDRVKFDPSGVLRLAEHAAWWIEHAEGRTSRPGSAAATFAASPGQLSRLPVVSILSPAWADVVLSGGRSPEAVTDAELSALSMPTLHLGGWDDLLVAETLHQYALTRGSLLVGPWGHELHPSIGPRQLAFVTDSPMGGDEWPGSVSWRRYEAGTGVASFRHDPLDPFPSRERPVDRRPLDRRLDVVRSSLLDGPLTISGRVRVRLAVWAEVESVDWVVRLVERRADGSVYSIADGVAVGAAGPFSLELSPVSYRVAAGSRVELEITGSDFPRLARNLGTGKDRYTTTESCVGTQSVDLSSTWVELPEER
ncbi:CocE/NonD family hydrolase [Tenggerimyces flavus]|uniref:CocE/NonD family hydrolase n=1 Tax=Tenggerimyces flavus TaxID=1708749 RepID=A0ABV7Y5U7_9ACTN|nr:CocE/NonD family hydrolase [Tenggerimyces flavus]MBM7790624.1 putative acyl esterase [Tenggerimyces flavus]